MQGGGFKVLTVQFYLDSITSRDALTLSLRLELEEIFSLKSVHELCLVLETLVVTVELFLFDFTVNIYRYKAIGANATSSVISYTWKCISPCLEIL